MPAAAAAAEAHVGATHDAAEAVVPAAADVAAGGAAAAGAGEEEDGKCAIWRVTMLGVGAASVWRVFSAQQFTGPRLRTAPLSATHYGFWYCPRR